MDAEFYAKYVKKIPLPSTNKLKKLQFQYSFMVIIFSGLFQTGIKYHFFVMISNIRKMTFPESWRPRIKYIWAIGQSMHRKDAKKFIKYSTVVFLI